MNNVQLDNVYISKEFGKFLRSCRGKKLKGECAHRLNIEKATLEEIESGDTILDGNIFLEVAQRYQRMLKEDEQQAMLKVSEQYPDLDEAIEVAQIVKDMAECQKNALSNYINEVYQAG